MSTSPSQVSTTIQVMFEVIPGSAGVVDGIGQTISSMNGTEALTVVANGAQTVAAVVSVAAVVGIASTPVVVGATLIAATLTITKNLIDINNSGGVDYRINLGDVITIAGNIATTAGAGLPGGGVAALSWAVAGGTFTTAGLVENGVPGGIAGIINDWWNNAKTPPRRDPLAIDLDGDGIETVGLPTAANPLYLPILGVLVSEFGELSTARKPFGRQARGRAFGVDGFSFVASPNSCWLAAVRASV